MTRSLSVLGVVALLGVCIGCKTEKVTPAMEPVHIGILSESLGKLSVIEVTEDDATVMGSQTVTPTGEKCTAPTTGSANVNCPSNAQSSCESITDSAGNKVNCVFTGTCFCGVSDMNETQGEVYARCDCPDDDDLSGVDDDLPIVMGVGG